MSGLVRGRGLSCNRPDTQVSSPVSGHIVHLFMMGLPFNQLSLGQEWIAQAKLIRCPAPLPETMQDPVLIKMLEVAPSNEGEGGTGKLSLLPRRHFVGEESRVPPSRGRRGPLPKTRKPRPQSGERNLHRKVLCREEPRPYCLLEGISPLVSRK